MYTNVPGVAAAPPAFGLVASAERPDLPRWEDGMAWIPERGATAYQLVPWCANPSVFTPSNPGAAYYRPVGARFADRCSTLNGPVDVERVRRISEAQTPFVVARELWTGAGSLADPYPIPGSSTPVGNARLADPSAATTVIGGSAASVAVAFGRLEQAALEATNGQPVMLHFPVVVLPQIGTYLDRIGRVLYSKAGNVVVADGGYPGTGPAGQAVGATCWAYATSPVAVLMSPTVVISDDPSTVDRASNTRTTWTSRVIAAVFDPVVHLATQITI